MSTWIRRVSFVFAFFLAATGAGISLDQFLIEQQQAVAKSPGDVYFTIRLKENKDRFQQGEIIQIELSFASSSNNKYQLDGAEYDHSGRVESDSYHIDPSSGATDPLKDRDRGAMAGGLRPMPVLDQTPYCITRDLNEYLRINKPGRYRLYIVSSRILIEGKTKRSLEGISTTSNILEFTIVPMNADWGKKQFQSAITAFESRTNLESPLPEKETQSAVRILRFLGTEEAARYMVRHFNEAEFDFGCGLIGSPYRETVITEMEDGIERTDYAITSWFLNILTMCRNRHLSEPYPYNEDKAKQAAWAQREKEAENARIAIRNEYINRLASAVWSKQDSAKAICLNTLLAENQKHSMDQQVPLSAGAAQAISSELAQAFFDLP
jgi:hypothetical protein